MLPTLANFWPIWLFLIILGDFWPKSAPGHSVVISCFYKSTFNLTVTFLKIVFPNIGGSLNFKRNFADFPPKLYQLGTKSILICNKKMKLVMMYLTFLHIVNKFPNDMMCFEMPT